MLRALQAGLRPREPRIKVLIPCRMKAGSAWSDACIHNVSSRGMLLAADLAVERGDYVDIRRGTLVVIGRVMWRKDRYFGILTQDRISVDSLVNEPRRATRPGPVKEERRAEARYAAEGRIARRVERSREIASALQFAFLLAAGLGAAAMAAAGVHDLLSRPFAAVSAAMNPVAQVTAAPGG